MHEEGDENFKLNHNDIKPDNVLIDYEKDSYGNIIIKRLVISDFGISTVSKSDLI